MGCDAKPMTRPELICTSPGSPWISPACRKKPSLHESLQTPGRGGQGARWAQETAGDLTAAEAHLGGASLALHGHERWQPIELMFRHADRRRLEAQNKRVVWRAAAPREPVRFLYRGKPAVRRDVGSVGAHRRAARETWRASWPHETRLAWERLMRPRIAPRDADCGTATHSGAPVTSS